MQKPSTNKKSQRFFKRNTAKASKATTKKTTRTSPVILSEAKDLPRMWDSNELRDSSPAYGRGQNDKKTPRPIPVSEINLKIQRGRLLKIGHASKVLSVSIDTLRRWEKAGKIEVVRTPGGTRLYSVSALQKINPVSVADFQTKNLTTEELLKKAENQTIDGGKWKIGVEDRSWKIESPSSIIHPQNTTLHPLSPIVNKVLLGTAVLSALILFFTSLITASYLFQPQPTQKFFQNNIASGLFLPFHRLAQTFVSAVDPKKAKELGFAEPEPPPLSDKDLLANNPNVLAVTASSRFLEVNSDTQINGSLFVRDSINGLALEATPSAGTMILVSGPTSLTVTKTAKLDQDVSTGASPSFTSLKLTDTKDQLVLGSNGTLTWTPTASRTVTVPDATGTIVLDTSSQTLTNKTISGSSNTITNIANSSLSNSKITVTAGTNLTGGGDINLGSSATLSLKDSISLIGTLGVSGATTLSSTLAVTGATTLSSTLAVTGATTLSSSLRVSGNVGIGFTGSSTVTAPDLGLAVAGSVGIGTSSPAYKLDVAGQVNASTGLCIAGDCKSSWTGVGGYTASNGITLSSQDFQLGGNLTRATGIDVNSQNFGFLGGNVGIGNSNPDYALKVTGTGYFSGFLGVGSSMSVSGNVGIGASLNVTSAGIFGSLGASSLSVSGASTLSTLTTSGNTGIGGSASVTGLTYALGGLRVNGFSDLTGNVGIGGTATVSSLLNANGILNSNGSATAPAYSFSNLTNAGLWTNGDGLLLTTGGSNTSGITVTGAGNVGVGTTSPTARLQVGTTSDTTAAGGITFGGDVNLYRVNANRLQTDDDLWFGGTLSSTGSFYLATSDVTNARIYNTGGMAWGTSGWADPGANNISVNGNVGIGRAFAAGATIAPLDVRNTNTGTTLNAYIGSSAGQFGILDNGNVGIGLSNPGTTLAVRGNLNVGYTGAVSDTLGLSVRGNVGIGTTSPAGALHVVGQCVTGDTKLRRRKKKKNGDWSDEYEDVEIKDIQEGDEILSLNEKTGEFEPHAVKGLMDMGIHKIYQLITSSGKSIRTTGNHPYLIRPTRTPSIIGGVFEVDQSPKLEQLNKDSFIALANKNTHFIIKISRKYKKQLYQQYQDKNKQRFFAPDIFARAINILLSLDKIQPFELKIDNEYTGYEARIREIITLANPSLLISYRSMGHSAVSFAHWAAYRVFKGEYATDLELAEGSKEAKEKDRGTQRVGLGIVAPVPLNRIRNARDLTSQDYHKLEDLSNTKWLKVYEIKTGMEVATVDGWEKVVSIKEFERERVFDIEVEGTHNFVGNDIVAHNTFITGNVGIGATSTAYNLDVWGNARITAGLTLDGLSSSAATALCINSSNQVVQCSGSSALTGTGVSGGVTYWNGTSSLSNSVANFYWDSSNNRLGIGTSTPYGQLQVGSGVTPGLFVNSGNVGIGTTSPATKLEILSTYNADIRLGEGGGLLTNIRWNIDSNQAEWDTDSYGYPIRLNGSNIVLQDASGGNVGIGTTTINSKLSVVGGVHIGSIRQGISAPTDGLFVDGNVGIGATSTAYNLDVWGNGRFSSALTVGGNIGIGGSASVTGLTYALGGLRVNGFSDLTGNLGIGGTASFNSLIVSSGNIIPSANDTYDLGSDASRWNNLYLGPSTLHLGTSTSDEYTLSYDTTNNRLGFNVNGSGPAEIVMDSSGNVGIGTTGPGASLSVAGNSTIGFGGATSIAGPANGLGVSGNLGIGTTTANSNLSVVGNAHIGSARQGISAPTDGLFVDGNVGIGATTSTNKLDVWGNARVAGTGTFDSTLTALNGLFGYSGVTAPTSGLAISGNVGVGTTSPLGQLHVVGQCVVGETKLKRRRRKKKNGKWIDEWEEVEIKDIKEGDQVLSLNEKTGEFEPHEVRGLLDMGKQEVFELITQSKLKIKTTAEHPYLVLQTPPLKSQFSTTFEADASNRVEDRGKDTIVAIANREKAFAVSLTKQEKQKLYKKYYSEGKPQRFGPEVFTRLIINLVVKNNIKVTKLVVDREYSTDYDKLIAEGLEKSLPGITVYIRSVGHNSPADRAAYFAHKNKEVQARSNLYGFRAAELHHHEWLHGSNSPLYLLTKENCTTEWVKVKYLRPGMTIATTLGWQKISNIVPRGKQQTFDIEVEGTHNFVGNNIVAHNTYINGSLGIGAYSGLTVPTNGLAISGNVGIGITTANSALSVAGGAHIGSIRQGISAPTDGLFVDGNVGIGATSTAYNLDVWGTGRFSSALTVGGNIGVGASLNVSSAGIFGSLGTSTLSVSGASNLSTLNVSGNTGIGGSASVTGLTYALGGLRVNGFSDLTGNVGVGGTATLSSALCLGGECKSAWTGSGNYTASNGLTLSGVDFQLGGSLTRATGIDIAGQNFGFLGNVGIGTSANGGARLSVIGGNVGIGTSSPLSPLNVWGNGTNSALFLNGNVGIGTSSSPTGLFQVGNSGTPPLFVNNANGNVGIGTTNPLTSLYVSGNAMIGYSSGAPSSLANGLAVSGNVGIGTTAPQAALQIGNNMLLSGQHIRTTGASPLYLYAIGGVVNVADNNADSTIGWQFSTTEFKSLNSSVLYASRTSGNVGIGTTGPGYKLEVNGTGYFSDFVGIGTSLSVSGNVGIGKSASIVSNLDAGSISTSTLSVSGTSNLSTLTTSGNTGIGGSASVTGLTYALGGLRVNGFSDLTGNVGIGGTAIFNSLAVFNGGISGNLSLPSGSFLASDGSASAPSHSFASDTDSGLWRLGANQIVLSTNGGGLNGLMVNANGNVGIGTTAPASKLQVTGGDITIDNGQFYYMKSTDNVSNGYLQMTGGNSVVLRNPRASSDTYIEAAGNINLADASDNIKLQVNTSTGNVGIGVTTVNSLLSVAGGAHIGSIRQGIAAPTDGLFVDGNVGIGATSTAYNLDVWGTARISSALTVGGNIGVGASVNAASAGIFGSLGTSTLSVSGNTTLSALTTSGNTGIGASASITGLTYALGGLRVNGFSDLTGNVGIGASASITSYLSAGSVSSIGPICLGGDCRTAWSQVGSTYTGSNGITLSGTDFQLGGNLTRATGIDVAGQNFGFLGNVGIGNSTPDYALKVTGTGYFSGFVGIGSSLSVSGNVGIGGTATISSLLNARGILNSNGSATAPAYSFTNLTNAGLWTNGDGLLLTTGGSNTSGITVTGAGNIGIGTTNPIGLLSVGATNNATDFNGVATAKRAVIAYSSSNTTVANDIGLVIRNEDTTANNTVGLHFSGYSGGNSNNMIGASIIGIMGARTTGQYHSGQLAFLTTAGANVAPAEVMRINGSGNVGIGDISPDSPLEVLNTSAQLRLSYADGTDSTLGVDTNGDLTITGTGDEIFLQGQLGIGAANPTSTFGYDLYVADTTATDIFVDGTTNGSTANLTLQARDSTPGVTNTVLSHAGTNAARGRFTIDNSASSGIEFTISPAGYVGVGMTAPDRQLHVASTIDITPTNAGLMGVGGTQLDISGATTNAAKKLVLGIDTTDNYGIIQTGNTDGTNYALALNPAGGNVGIGTTSPLGRLDITDTSNTAASLLLTNNTATTIGNGANTLGVLDLQSTSLTTGNFLNIELNGLTSGKGLNLTSTSTGLTSGYLAYFNWNPGSTTTATGDLVNIGIGSSGNIGNLLNITDDSSSIFSVSETSFITSLPSSFTSAGDVAVAYDLNFTNPTASYIKSSAPLYIVAGETFNSSDLTLQTYNSGSIILDTGLNGNVGIGVSGVQNFTFAPTGNLGIGTSLTSPGAQLTVGKNALIGFSGSQSAPATGLAVSGNVGIGITTANSLLSVAGGAHIGSVRQGISAPTDGLFVDGNVGIGATTSSNKLDVWGNARVAGTGIIDSTLSVAGVTTLSAPNGALSFTGSTPSLTSGSSVFGLFAGGNVGIGTTGNLYGGLTVRGAGTGTNITLQTYGSGLGQGLTVLDNGNVGIGTTGPGSSLSVAGSSTIGFGGTTSIAGPSNGLAVSGNLGVGLTSPLAPLHVWGNGTNSAFFLNGNVGIGFTSPDRLLQIGSDINITGSAASILGANGAQFSITGSTANTTAKKLTLGVDTTDNYGVIQAGNTDGTAYNLVLQPGGGNVGIGTTSPLAALDIRNAISVGTDDTTEGQITFQTTGTETAPTIAASAGNLQLTTSTGWIVLTPDNGIQVTGNGTNIWWQANNGNATFDLYKSSATTGLTITNTANASDRADLYVAKGNVGIGTTTANSTLSVAGGAHIGSIRQGIAAPTDGLFVDGNVGIGATTSSNKLDVWGNARIAGTGIIDSTLTALNGLIGYSGVTAPTSGLAVSGNVGIGTTSPVAPLHIWGNNTNSAFFLNGNVGIGTTTPTYALDITGNSALWQSVYGTDDGLVGYWPFSEGTGSKAYDRGPSGNDGTLTGAGGLPVWTTGKYGNALDFDGTDDYVLSANSETDLTTFTAELWINPDSASPGTTQTILSHGSSPTDDGWTLEMPSGQNKLRLTFNGVGNYDSNTGILAAGVWQHAVVTLTGTTATFYLNGRQVGTATTGSMGAATHKYSIGATPGGTNFFSGLIDDVRVYNRVLSADEIKAHYLRGDTPGKTIAIETSTAAGNLFGLRGLVTDTGIVTTGTDTTYGSRIDLTRTGATGGTINSYGQYIALTADNAGAGTSNSWGLYVNTSGSTADNNYSAYFSGNVGIGTTSPGSALTVIGNVGIGTSAAGASLQVNGGGLFGWGTASVAAPANGLGINGNVGIGTTSPSAPLEVRGSGTGATIAKFTDENNTGCTLATGGTITCSSDINLKKNITEIDYGLDSLMSLHPVTYNWKSEADGTIQSLGFIAQEIEQVIPKLVTTDPSSGLKELNTIGLIPVITKSIQQLNDKIAAISINDEGELVVPKLKTGSIVLDPSIASASAQVTADANNNASLDLSDKLASLENRIAALESTSKEATTSGENTSVGTELTPEVKLTPPDILLATGSAQLASLTVHSEATVSGKLTAYDLDVQNGLKALGKTTLADTTIAGTLTVDGTLSIENGSEINVIGAGSSPDGGPQGLLGGGTGILYLQKSSLAQGLDIFDGKVTIDKTGSLIAQKVSAPEVVTNKLTISNTPIASDSAALGTQVEPTIGSSSLPQGTLELAVFTNQADDKSKIFVTPRSSTLGQSLYIKEVVENSGFVVGVDRPIPNDVNFDWWIVGTN